MDTKGNIICEKRGNNKGIRNCLCIILTLIKLKSNFSFEFLAYWFGISLTQTTTIYKHMCMCLYTFFKLINSIHLLPLNERLARGYWFDVDEFQISNRLTLFLDGNLTPTSSAPSKELRKKMHSGKDKVECISIIGIVDGFGKFQYLSHSFAGSIPDQVSLNFLSLSNTVSLVTENEFLVGDAAFSHIRQFCDNVLIPIYPKEKKELNQAISKYRSLIERAWCQIEKWSILLKYRLVWKEYQSSEDIMKIHNETMFIITSLYNIFNKPLGESSSLPSKHGNVFHGRPNLNYHREILNVCDQTIHEYIKKKISK
ncbi:hypothetical protein ACTFIY_000812 [Dictyostelium cf. discoideum]